MWTARLSRSASPRSRAQRPELYTFEPIGTIRSPYKEKFGIPRQSGMAEEVRGEICLRKDPHWEQALKGLGGFSHIWIIWVFHKHDAKKWRPSIRPPRLGGAKKVGVLASRSPHRPNPIGLSAVKLERIRLDAKPGPVLEVSGLDILDGTPVLDIKPYLPYADVIPGASSGWAGEPIARYPVEFMPEALKSLEKIGKRHEGGAARLKTVIEDIVGLDPRPASQRRKLPPASEVSEGTQYAVYVIDFDVRWQIRGDTFVVMNCVDGPREGLGSIAKIKNAAVQSTATRPTQKR